MTDANRKRILGAVFSTGAILAASHASQAHGFAFVDHFAFAVYMAYVAIGCIVELIRPGTI